MLIASGPSLTPEQVNQTKHLPTIAINDNYLLAPWAEYHYFCDKKFWEWHKDRPEYKAYQGIRITQDTIEDTSVLKIKGQHKDGLSESPEVIHYGSNSGYQALNLAYLMGAEKIILLGYDMKIADNGASHWFGDHPDKVRSNYQSWWSRFSVAADQLKEQNIKVINCSPDSALQCFTKMSLEDAIQ